MGSIKRGKIHPVVASRRRAVPLSDYFLYFIVLLVLPIAAAQSTDEKAFRPTDTDYLTSIAYKIAPGIAIGALSFLSGIVFLLLRCVCNTCGKRDATRIYSSADIARTKIGMGVVTLVLGSAFVVGFLGNQKFSKGIDDFASSVIDAADRALAKIQEANEKLEEAGETAAQGVTADGEEIREQAEEARGEIDSVESRRSLVLILAFAVPLGGAVLSMLAMLVRTGWVTWLFVLAAVISLLVNWVSFGVHFGLDSVLNDICTDLDSFLADPLNSNAVDDVIRCVGASDAKEARDKAISAVEKWEAEFNRNSPTDPIDIDTASLDTTDEAELDTAIETEKAKVQEARVKVAGAPDSNTKQDMLRQLDQLEAGLDALNLVNEVETCKLIRETVGTVRNVVCNDIKGAVKLIFIANAIIGVILLPGTILGIKGVKRFSQRGDKMAPAPTKEEFQMRQMGGAAGAGAAAGGGYAAAYANKDRHDTYGVQDFEESRPPTTAWTEDNGTMTMDRGYGDYEPYGGDADWARDDRYYNDWERGGGGYYDDYSVV